jgi:hypothetical protein
MQVSFTSEDLIKAAIAQWPEIKELGEGSVIKPSVASKRQYAHFHFDDYWIELSVRADKVAALASWDIGRVPLPAEGDTPEAACAALKQRMENIDKEMKSDD